MNEALQFLTAELTALRAEGLLRDAHPRSYPPDTIALCSNDYLGYASDPLPVLSAQPGAGASRLISGDTSEHRLAERTLADWTGHQAALLFSSGYAANVGTLSALAGKGDVIVSDALNHASIIDGCRLSGAVVRVVPHLDAAAVDAALVDASAARRRWVVTESYFSMDGDSPDLGVLRRVCDRRGAGLIVDEAHALGICGPEGAGLCRATGIQPDVLVGTLGKSLGLHGAFVAGTETLRSFLWNRARSFVYSTGISPIIAGAAAARVARIRADDDSRGRLFAVSTALRETLRDCGAVVAAGSTGPIIPWVVGPPSTAVALGARLVAHGVFAATIRPPTVPKGSCRLRLTANARLSDEALERVRRAIIHVSRETVPCP